MAQPDLFYADHPRLPFHRCTTKRSFCNQTRWVKLDADFPPSGSSLQAFPQYGIGEAELLSPFQREVQHLQVVGIVV